MGVFCAFWRGLDGCLLVLGGGMMALVGGAGGGWYLGLGFGLRLGEGGAEFIVGFVFLCWMGLVDHSHGCLGAVFIRF